MSEETTVSLILGAEPDTSAIEMMLQSVQHHLFPSELVFDDGKVCTMMMNVIVIYVGRLTLAALTDERALNVV